ncbi:MAG: hypothetical protein ACREFX_12350, partial [Opitutaceae bacterium]
MRVEPEDIDGTIGGRAEGRAAGSVQGRFGPVLAGWAAVALFLALVGRFWHPYYGFTRFLQMGDSQAALAVPEMRGRPVFVYPGGNGYDGALYAQIAFHPLLGSPDLKRAMANVPYRARRILGSALAWAFAGGNPERIANLYACLNLVVWLLLAALVWRLLPVRDWPGWTAWAGFMFSAGALDSVRLALTDLPAVALVGAALFLAERGRPRRGLAALALAGLARETSLAYAAGWWEGPPGSAGAWRRNIARTLAAALPLAAWMAYVRWKEGPAPQGFGNFGWPAAGFARKAAAIAGAFRGRDGFFWLHATTALALVGLSVQAAYLLIVPFRNPAAIRPKSVRAAPADRRGRIRGAMADPWWRAGIVGVALMTVLGRAVWAGDPGAAMRVLLPMSLAFAVTAVRRNAGAVWIVAGSLTVCSGVLALIHVPADPRELAAGRAAGRAYIFELDGGWYGREA